MDKDKYFESILKKLIKEIAIFLLIVLSCMLAIDSNIFRFNNEIHEFFVNRLDLIFFVILLLGILIIIIKEFSKLSTEEKDKEISGKIADLLNVEFDITNKQLINFLIIKLNENENIVFVVHDALVADGRSHQIIIDELENHYYGNKVENHYKFSEYLDYLEKNKETNR